MKIKIIIISLLFLLTIFTRFKDLSTNPPALFSDEVDAGYQAFIFNRQGTDYFGNRYPVHFHSFSDWRTSAHIYSIALAQRFISNPEIAVRLPSAVYSSFAIIIFYLITNSFFATFLLIISPWAIHFGRTGFEVSGMVFVIFLGLYYWLKFLKSKQTRFLFLSTLFFCLSPYFYSTSKLFLPIIFLAIIIVWYKEIIQINKRLLLLIFIFSTLLLTPMGIDTLKGNSGFRFSYISIFAIPHREQITDHLRYEDIYTQNLGKVGVKTPFISFILHNKYELILEKFVKNYITSFSTEFLLISGDGNLRQGFSNHGMLYLIDGILILTGLLIFFRKPTKLGWFFLLILIFAPIPFSLTSDSLTPHSTRLILMLPSILYFISLNQRIFLYPVYLCFFMIFWHNYTIHYPQISAAYWHTNMKESVQNSIKYPNVNIYYSDKFEPFLPFFLYYDSYVSSDNKPITNHLIHVNNSNFDGTSLDNKYFFGQVNFDSLSNSPDLYVIPKSEYTALNNKSKFIILKTISKKYLNSEEFYILKLNNDNQAQ